VCDLTTVSQRYRRMVDVGVALKQETECKVLYG